MYDFLRSNFDHIPYNQKFSRESNFRYFREWFENVKICLREKLKSYISGINILCILRFAKNCTRKNKDDKIAKFDTHKKFRLYGRIFVQHFSQFLTRCLRNTDFVNIRFDIKVTISISFESKMNKWMYAEPPTGDSKVLP